jgi:hypothetical protein
LTYVEGVISGPSGAPTIEMAPAIKVEATALLPVHVAHELFHYLEVLHQDCVSDRF